MFRSICMLLLLLIACTALAAPAPKDPWETPIDPDRDCKFEIKEKTVTIELPGGYHEFDPKRDCFNAPRLLRDVKGDFAVQVCVSASFRPSTESSVKGEDPRVAAGLLLIGAGKNVVRLEYGAFRRDGNQKIGFTNRMRGPQVGFNGDFVNWGPKEWKPNKEHIYMRIEREGGWIRNVISPDGKTWERHNSVKSRKLPDTFKVGIAAYSTSTEPFKVRFDQFKLIRGQKNSK